MAETPKNLGQARPAAESLVDLYTVPASKRAVLSTIVVCNINDQVETFRVAHAIAGASDSLAQYLYFDEKVPAGKTFMITIGMCLQANDVLRVQSGRGDLVFNVYGVEI